MVRVTKASAVAAGIALALVLAGCQPSSSGVAQVDQQAAETAAPQPAAAETDPDTPSTGVVSGDDGSAAAILAQAVVRPDALAEDLGLAMDGVPHMALRWADDNGDNVAILSRRDESQTGTIELFADHYVVSDGQGPRRLRHVQDGVVDCDLDEFADFFYGSFRVTDADSDGLGEVLFAYHYTCAGGVDPASLKVLALEDGEKYIVRGQSWSSAQTRDAMGGDTLPDGAPEPPAEQWPPALWEQTSALYAEAAIR
jgi:hypothetical protein